jgi:hypothetical protein
MKNPPRPPFAKGGSKETRFKSPFEKGGFRGIYKGFFTGKPEATENSFLNATQDKKT